MKTSLSKATGYILIVLAIIIVITVAYKNSSRKNIPVIFSSKDMLTALWERYKEIYLEQGTLRTLDKQQSFITTSEGESYTMLRAVWMDDHAVFDTSWKWTSDNLKQKNGNLFSWLFGKRQDGSYGILFEQNGQNSASDADTDIALALIFAYAKWKDPRYINSAKLVINDIWIQEVIMINNRPYLAANNVEKNFNDDIIVNPSYFAPYAYRIFAEIDPAHNWNGVVDTSYEILKGAMTSNLNKTTSAGLPPNWIALDRRDASIRIPRTANLDTNYSFDALRVPWRIALDAKWYGDPRANEILPSFVFLNMQWENNKIIYTAYGHDGSVITAAETPAMYAGSIGAISTIDPENGKEIYESKLQSLYDPDTDSWKYELSYYDANWAWFGMALYNDQLPNLWATVSTSTRNRASP